MQRGTTTASVSSSDDCLCATVRIKTIHSAEFIPLPVAEIHVTSYGFSPMLPRHMAKVAVGHTLKCFLTGHWEKVLRGPFKFTVAAPADYKESIPMLRYAIVCGVKDGWPGHLISILCKTRQHLSQFDASVHGYKPRHTLQNKRLRLEVLDIPCIILKQHSLIRMSEAHSFEIASPLREPLIGGDAERLARGAAKKKSVEVRGDTDLVLQNGGHCLSISEVPVSVWRAVHREGGIISPQCLAEGLVYLKGSKNRKPGLSEPDVHSAAAREETDGRDGCFGKVEIHGRMKGCDGRDNWRVHTVD